MAELPVLLTETVDVAAHSNASHKSQISLPCHAALVLYGFTFFASAFLLFQVQLIISKYTLPWFGGAPAVFTACMLFFQLLLLLGYAYARALTKLAPRAQVALHSLNLALAFVLLAIHWFTWSSPVLPSETWKPLASGRPLLQVLWLLTASVALPLFTLSTTSPLLQAWFSRRYGLLPYRWYAVSNAGSLLGLVTYPFAVEPELSLRRQANLWFVGFATFAVACAWVAIAFSRRPFTREVNQLSAPAEVITPPSARRRIAWLLLAACGSVMMLSTTNQICQDIAVVPLLWVLPLSVYLLSFILCFDSDRWYSRASWSLVLGLATLLVAFALYHPGLPLVVQIVIYSVALFGACMVCHGELARIKPVAAHLTSFYLIVAAGGSIGGLFVSIVAPMLFKGFWEFQLSLWTCCVLLCAVLLRDSASWIYRPQPCLLAFSTLLLFFGPLLAGFEKRPVTLTFTFIGTVAFTVFILTGQRPAADDVKRTAARLCVAFTAVVLAVVLMFPTIVRNAGMIASSRNFYGALTVSDVASDNPGIHARWLRHGKILHGFQYLSAQKRQVPTGYYAPNSGIGVAIANQPARLAGKNLRIGVVGLGVGTIAAYGHPGDYVRFYEINPDVIRVAASPAELFSYVADTPAQVDVILGDARICLERELAGHDPQRFDVLAIDAFNGDAIPLHLLTTEAFNVYLQHLRGPDSVLAFHISNRSVDLSPAIARVADQFGQTAWLVDTSARGNNEGSSIWVIVSRNRNLSLGPLTLLKPNPQFPVWTDDYSNVLAVLR